MPVYGLAQRPPDPTVFRSTPLRSWTGLASQRQKHFVSTNFPNQSSQERIASLSLALFGHDAPDDGEVSARMDCEQNDRTSTKEQPISNLRDLVSGPWIDLNRATGLRGDAESTPLDEDDRISFAENKSPQSFTQPEVRIHKTKYDADRPPPSIWPTPSQRNSHLPRGSVPNGARPPPGGNTLRAHGNVPKGLKPPPGAITAQENTHLPRGSVPNGARPPPGAMTAQENTHLPRGSVPTGARPPPGAIVLPRSQNDAELHTQPAPIAVRQSGQKAKASTLWVDDDDSDFEDASGSKASKRDKRHRPSALGMQANRAESDSESNCTTTRAEEGAIQHGGLMELPNNHYDDVARASSAPSWGDSASLAGAAEASEEDEVWGRCVLPPAGARGGGGLGSWAGQGAANGQREKRCGICGETGHDRRKCPQQPPPDAAQPAPPRKKPNNNAKRKSSEASNIATSGSATVADAQGPKSHRSESLLRALAAQCTHVGREVGSDETLGGLFESVRGCAAVVVSLVYSTGQTHLRLGKSEDAGKEVSAVLLHFPELSSQAGEKKSDWFLPLEQQAGFGTSRAGRLRLLERVLGEELGAVVVSLELQTVLVGLVPQLSAGVLLSSRAGCLSVLAWLLDPECDRPALDALAEQFAGIEGVEGDAAGRGGDGETAGMLALQDLALCGELYGRMVGEVERRGMASACEQEMGLVPVLALLERTGIGFSPSALVQHRAAMEQKLLDLEEEAAGLCGHAVLLTSPQQVCAVLFDELKLPPPAGQGAGAVSKFKGAHQQHSTNEETLYELTKLHPLPAVILEHRHLSKMLSTYVLPLCQKAVKAAAGAQGLARLFSHWSQTSTSTGRLASSAPNLQNIPKADSVRLLGRSDITADINFRDAFSAHAGFVLLAGDYVQCELRVMAHFSADSSLVQLLCSAGVCPYVGIAAKVLGKTPGDVTPQERSIFKTVVLGLLFGLGKKNLAAKLSLREAEAAGHIAAFFAAYPAVKRFQQQAVSHARSAGYVSTLTGRQRLLPDAKLTGPGAYMKRSYAERQAVNTIIQGSAADLIKVAMQRAMKRLVAEGLADQCRCCLQIHDELVFEVAPAVLERCAAIVRTSMAESTTLLVPMPVKLTVGASWGSMEPVPDTPAASVGEAASSAGMQGRPPQTPAPAVAVAGSGGSGGRANGTVAAPGESAAQAATEGGPAGGRGAARGAALDVDDLFDFGSASAAAARSHRSAGAAHSAAVDVPGAAGSGPAPRGVGVSSEPAPGPAHACASNAPERAALSPPPLEQSTEGDSGRERPPQMLLFQRGPTSFLRGGGEDSASQRQQLQRPRLDLADIAKTGLNLRPFAASRLAGGTIGQPWSKHKTLASALLDDDADNLELD